MANDCGSPGLNMSSQSILNFVQTHPDPVVTLGEIAEHFGSTNEGVNYHMRKLVADGKVARKEVGASAVVYWAKG